MSLLSPKKGEVVVVGVPHSVSPIIIPAEDRVVSPK